MGNCCGLCLDIRVAAADGHSEWELAERMLRRIERRHGVKRRTPGAHKGYQAGEFLRTVGEQLGITPHVPVSADRVTLSGPADDARRRMLRCMKTTAYQLSQKLRKKVEQLFGWLKQPGGLRKVRHVGRWKVQQVAWLRAAGYNLLRPVNLEVQKAAA